MSGYFCIPAVCGFVLHMLGANAVFVFACLCVFLAAAVSLRVLSCVPLDKAIQASPWTPPQSRGPYKMPDCGAETQGNTD